MKWVNNDTVEKVPVLWKSGSISTLLLYDKATDCRFLFPSTSPAHGEDFFKRLGKADILQNFHTFYRFKSNTIEIKPCELGSRIRDIEAEWRLKFITDC